MTTRCSHCGSEATPYLVSKDYNIAITENEFRYFKCTGCGLLFISPVPDDLGRYYPQSYSAYEKPTVDELQLKSGLETSKLKIIQNYVTSGRLLEIGPASGGFAYLAKVSGFEVDCIEMDKNCCEILRDVIQVNAVNSNDIVEAFGGLGHYNVIVMWHVIEHLINPLEVIEVAARHLAPGGILVLATPNPRSIQFKTFKSYWVHLDAPRHLHLIDPAIIAKKVLSCGFQVVSLTTKGEYNSKFNDFAWWEWSIKNMIKRSANRRNIRNSGNAQDANNITESIIKTIIRNIVTKLFNLTVCKMQNIEGYGAAYTMVIKKAISSMP